jgi:hypothetical protein
MSNFISIKKELLLPCDFQVAAQKEIIEDLKKAEIETGGQVFTMRYNGPFTPVYP